MTGFADGLFADWRADREFILNEPGHADSCFLITGPNFGIGSSREHAVWALRDYGFKAVISTRFGEIFRGNALANGLLPISLDSTAVSALFSMAESDERMELTVDLAALEVRHRSATWSFSVDGRARRMILAGLDEIALTKERCPDLSAYETARLRWLPVIRPSGAAPGQIRPEN